MISISNCQQPYAAKQHLSDCSLNNSRLRNHQKGAVLFFTLIALVIMMLTSVALIRSVDTSTSISGNLAYKQSAVISADSGIETAMATLSSPTLDKDSNTSANAMLGYYATAQQRNLTTTFTWDNTNSALATGTGITAGKDASGNTMRYVIERMCTATGGPTKANCMFGKGQSAGKSFGQVDVNKDATPKENLADIPVYRVTARVVGPRNTISYVQAYLY